MYKEKEICWKYKEVLLSGDLLESFSMTRKNTAVKNPGKK